MVSFVEAAVAGEDVDESTLLHEFEKASGRRREVAFLVAKRAVRQAGFDIEDRDALETSVASFARVSLTLFSGNGLAFAIDCYVSLLSARMGFGDRSFDVAKEVITLLAEIPGIREEDLRAATAGVSGTYLYA